jgi:protein-S-isoprenylcysteine O-methyltransferase Ste14
MNRYDERENNMALREEFENSGKWLFRWRGYLPIAGLTIVFLAFLESKNPSGTLDYLWEVICVAVSFFGLAIRIYTIGHTPRGTSGRNARRQVASTLNTTGAYSLLRNPLYLGNLFMGLGIAMFIHLWWLPLIYILVFWIYYERIIYAEESFLREKFGDEYLNWAKTTPVFIPRFGVYKKPAMPFSLKNVLRREYNGFFAVIVIMAILDIIGGYFYEGKMEFDVGWIVALGVSFAIWMTLRTLKKRTNLFKVDGR